MSAHLSRLKSELASMDAVQRRVVLEHLRAEVESRRAAEQATRVNRPTVEQLRRRLLKGLTPDQVRYVTCTATKRVITGGRRSGKSHAVRRDLIRSAIGNPGRWVVYIALTRGSAEKIIWEELKADLRHFGIEHSVNEAQLIIKVKGGARIMLGGCDSSAELEKYRGLAYELVVVDECGAQRQDLKKLHLEVILPALQDYRGRITFLGTPGTLLTGYWYQLSEADRDPDATWTWTMRDNPFYAGRVEQQLAEVMAERGWTPDDVTYRREWLGEWVLDEGALVYPYEPELNGVETLPAASELGHPIKPSDWRFVMGVDVGVVDASTFVVLARCRQRRETYVIHAEEHRGMIVDQVAEKIRLLTDEVCRLHGAKRGQLSVVMDSGGMGKAHAETCARRYALHIIPARKQEKSTWIRFVRTELASGRLKVLDGWELDCLRSEWSVLGWSDDRLQHSPRQADHLSDACLYAMRALHEASSPRHTDPTINAPGPIDPHLAKLERKARTARRYDGRWGDGRLGI